MDLGESLWQPFEKVAARAHSRPVERIRILLRQGMGKRVCCMTASMRGRGGSSGHGWFRMSRALFSGSASPRAHCLRPRRARRDAAAAAAQCALQCMLAVKQRRRLTERVLSVLNACGAHQQVGWADYPDARHVPHWHTHLPSLDGLSSFTTPPWPYHKTRSR